MLQQSAEPLAKLSEHTIYLMGGSFILGSLFTILMLIALDYMRMVREQKEKEED